MTKNRIAFFAGLAFILLNPLARADLGKAGHEIKESAVEAADKTVEVGKKIGHATAETAKEVGHAVANGARKGYHATRDAVTGNSSGSTTAPPANEAKDK